MGKRTIPLLPADALSLLSHGHRHLIICQSTPPDKPHLEYCYETFVGDDVSLADLLWFREELTEMIRKLMND